MKKNEVFVKLERPLEIVPGVYQLTVDIVNPRPDRAVNRNWTYADIWKAKSKIIIKEISFNLVDKQFSYFTIEKYGGNGNGIINSYQAEKWNAIVSNLEPLEKEDMNEIVQNLKISKNELISIFDQLQTSDKIDCNDIKAAFRKCKLGE